MIEIPWLKYLSLFFPISKSEGELVNSDVGASRQTQESPAQMEKGQSAFLRDWRGCEAKIPLPQLHFSKPKFGRFRVGLGFPREKGQMGHCGFCLGCVWLSPLNQGEVWQPTMAEIYTHIDLFLPEFLGSNDFFLNRHRGGSAQNTSTDRCSKVVRVLLLSTVIVSCTSRAFQRDPSGVCSHIRSSFNTSFITFFITGHIFPAQNGRKASRRVHNTELEF